MACQWRPREIACAHGDQCSCDLFVTILHPSAKGFSCFVSRYSKGRRRGKDEMITLALAILESSFLLVDGSLVRHSRDFDRVYVHLVLQMRLTRNAEVIPAFCYHSAVPQAMGDLKTDPSVIKAYREWDMLYFSQQGVELTREFFYSNVWLESRFSSYAVPKDVGVPSLLSLAARALSFYNRAFGSQHGHPCTVHSLENLYPHKIGHVFAKIDRPTRDLNGFAREISFLVPRALTRMYTFMDVKKYFSSRVYERGLNRFATVPQKASSGVRAGGSGVIDDPTVPYRVVRSATGQKREHMEYALNEFRALINGAKKGRVVIRDMVFTYSHKGEIFNSFGMNAEEAARIRNKDRLFKIGFLTGLLVELNLFSLRQKIERGKMIKIGHNWWGGGAQKLFEEMHGDDPDMCFDDGDVSGFDFSVNRVLLELYFSQAGIYYKFDSRSMDTKVYKNLLRAAIQWITARVTHVFAGVWKLIIGGMPSGLFSTSHGDSWIMGFLFWLFVEYVLERNPGIRRVFEVYFYNGKIRIIVYGDDHILGIHKEFHQLINENEFAKFLLKFFDMELRDIKSGASLLSEPNKFGGCKVSGIVFLQRHLILTPDWVKTTSRIVSYKPVWKYIWKIPFSSDNGVRVPVDVLLSCIGNAYDTTGTNRVAYDFLRFVFVFVAMENGIQLRDVPKMYSESMKSSVGKDVTKMMRKSGLTLKEMLGGFPSLEELHTRNNYDSSAPGLTNYDLDSL